MPFPGTHANVRPSYHLARLPVPTDRNYSTAEELAHTLTHGIGALIAVLGLVVLVVTVAETRDPWHITGAALFGGALVLMYAASTAYHHAKSPALKLKLRAVDHAAIYLLIAGTYSPFMLVMFRDSFGLPLFIGLWVLAAAGVIFKIFATGRFEKTSVAIYLFMGWVILFVAKPVFQAMETGGLILLVAGGLAYTVGVVFYRWHSLPHHHTIWHLFVMAGSAFHYFAVLYFVKAPLAP